jgi:hypothetical protein
LKHGTVPVMATKAERRAARERVSAYHESQLAELLGHVGAELDRYRADEIDVYAADQTIHLYHRAAAELWKFCFARGGGAHAEFIAGLLDRMTADAETSTGGSAPHRDDTNDPTVLRSPCGVPRSVMDRGHAKRRLSALTAVLLAGQHVSVTVRGAP